MSELKIFGIRHHGVGCSRALVSALQSYKPDVVLIEGPPDGEDMLQFVGNHDLVTPAAILVYKPDEPQYASFYPFASFSPEWIAARYAKATGAEVKFVDLPVAVRLALEEQERERSSKSESDEESVESQAGEIEDGESAAPSKVEERAEDAQRLAQDILDDPLGALAQASGMADPDGWEDRAIEESAEPGDIFPALLEAATLLRAAVRDARTSQSAPESSESSESSDLSTLARKIALCSGGEERTLESLREATMRRGVREALKKGYERIAVVCGAWHAPTLDLNTEDPVRKTLIPKKKDDDAILSKLPKVKTTSTWTPWTFARLARRSGYGAGIEAPGWFEALWLASPEADELERICGGSALCSVIDDSRDPQVWSDADESKILSREKSTAIVRWTVRAAKLLRNSGFDSVSSADAIGAARLADSLAAMRERGIPNLEDARDAIGCILGRGRNEALSLVKEKLEVGVAAGRVPSSVPTIPLERDINAQIKTLRLKKSESETLVKLDLREETGRKKSVFFHRLALLDVPWASAAKDDVRSTGTFRECWTLEWTLECAISIVEASRYGSTLLDASSNAAAAKLVKSQGLGETIALYAQALDAEIAREALQTIYDRVRNDSALTTDVDELLDAIPPLVRLVRYGNVQKTDAATFDLLLESLFERAIATLPSACVGLSETAAAVRVEKISALRTAILTLNDEGRSSALYAAFRQTAENSATSRLISGKLSRILYEDSVYDEEKLTRQFGLFVSPTVASDDVVQWLEGFISGPGQSLLWLEGVWRIMDAWLVTLDGDSFQALLPILRRSFADFSYRELAEMGKTVAKLRGVEKISAAISDETAAIEYPDLSWKLEGVLTTILGRNPFEDKELTL